MEPSPSTVLSVAIPAYNRAPFLRPLLEALAAQARPDDDLVVVDDGSTDGTPEVVAAMPRFRLVRNPANLGMVGNWNACLHEAKHDWICIVHHDDKVLPGALDALRRACAAAGGPALITHWREGAAEDDVFRYRRCEPGAWAVLRVPTVPSGATVHRAIVDALGGFDPRWKYSTDLEYFPRVCARYPLLIVESPGVVRYQLHGDNYQYHTWRQPDFDAQLVEIQRLIVSHAGLADAPAAQLVARRMHDLHIHMFMAARRLGDRGLLRQTAARLGAHPGLNWRLRLLTTVAAATGWCPVPRHDPSEDDTGGIAYNA